MIIMKPNIIRNKAVLFTTLAAVCLVLRPVVSSATLIAASFPLPQTQHAGPLFNGMDGFEFVPTQNLLVTDLGWYDHDGDGLLQSHPVAIFDASSQAILASASVTTSSALDLVTHFRFETLPVPIALTAGHSYTVAGLALGPNFDPYVTNPVGGTTFGPVITFTQYRYEFSNSLVFPTSTDPGNPFFGPNFRYTSVPESGCTSALLGLSLLGIAGFASRLRKAQRLPVEACR